MTPDPSSGIWKATWVVGTAFRNMNGRHSHHHGRNTNTNTNMIHLVSDVHPGG